MTHCRHSLPHRIKALEDILLRKAKNTPLLTKIAIEGSKRNWQSDLPALRGLSRVADEQKVSLVIIDDGSGQSHRERRDFLLSGNAVERGWRMDGSVRWAKAACVPVRPPFYTVVDVLQ